MEDIGDRIQRKIEEEHMGLESRTIKDLFIKSLTINEYNKFISFIKEKTPNKKGYEAIAILLDAYDRAKSTDKIMEYNEELQKKIVDLETKLNEKENTEDKKWIK
jgi:Zn-dependent M32 family carboxypeptidase